MLEAAILGPVIALLAFGVLDFGMLFGSTMNLATAVRAGARVGVTTTAAGPAGDAAILSAISGSLHNASATRIVIYMATNITGPPPTACQNGTPVSGVCNVYSATDVGLTQGQLDAGGKSTAWPVTSRQPGIDDLGVWVAGTHNPLVPIVPSPKSYSDQAIMRISELPPPTDAVSKHPGDPDPAWQLPGNHQSPGDSSSWFAWEPSVNPGYPDWWSGGGDGVGTPGGESGSGPSY